MGRQRMLHPDFFAHEGLAEVSRDARLLFTALWTIADRNGRLEDRPKRIKLASFPYDDDVDVEKLLNELASHRDRFIVRYEVDGQKLIEIPKFLRWQKPHPHEAKGVLPGMDGTSCDVITCPDIPGSVSECTPESESVSKSETKREEPSALPRGGGDLVLVPDPPKRKKREPAAPRDTWLTPFDLAHREVLGGGLNMGEAAKALKAVVDALGPERALAFWRHYLAVTEPRFVSVTSFAAKLKAYDPAASRQTETTHGRPRGGSGDGAGATRQEAKPAPLGHGSSSASAPRPLRNPSEPAMRGAGHA